MPDTAETLTRQIWTAVFAASFSRLAGEGIAHEKAADQATTEADFAVKSDGVKHFLGGDM